MVTGAIEAPKRLEDLHVRRDLVASLLLRTLAFADQLTGAALEQRLGLPFETFSPLIDEFEKNQLMDTRGVSNDLGLEGRPYPVKMNYAISGAGRQRAAEMSAVQTRYLGPCPVNFEDYLALIRSQVSGKSPVTDAQLKRALGELELEQHIIDQIGGAWCRAPRCSSSALRATARAPSQSAWRCSWGRRSRSHTQSRLATRSSA